MSLSAVNGTGADRAWAEHAIRGIMAEKNRSSDTHLFSVPLPEKWGRPALP